MTARAEATLPLFPWPVVALAATAAGLLSGLRIFVSYNWIGIDVTILESVTSGLMDWWLWIPLAPLAFAAARRFEPKHMHALALGAVHLSIGAALAALQIVLFALCSAAVRTLRFGDPFQVDLFSPFFTMFAPGLLTYGVLVAVAWWRGNRRELDRPRARERLTFRAGRDQVLLAPDEIDWIAAAGNYLELHARGETHLVRETMQRAHERLGEERFARIHRSTLVRRDVVERFGETSVVLRDGTRLSIGRKFRGAVRP